MSGAPAWIPSDDELDAVARSLRVAEPDAQRIEEGRTSLLASAATAAQQKRRTLAPALVALSATLAVAAAVLLWLVAKPSITETHPRETITAIGNARFERESPWPDFAVRLDDGQLAIEVAELAAGERFRVKTGDAEIQGGGTRVVVGAARGRLASVLVERGRVELRTMGQVIVVSAGQSWPRVKTVERHAIDPADPRGSDTVPAVAATTQPARGSDTVPAVAATTQASLDKVAPPSRRIDPAPAGPSVDSSDHAPVRRSSPARRAPAVKIAEPAAKTSVAGSLPRTADAPARGTTVASDSSSNDVTPPPSTVQVSPPAIPSAKPGEVEFRAGVTALRNGDASGAASSFAAACRIAAQDDIGEDACFWFGAAAKRAGQPAQARAALAGFLQRFPSSHRAGEAAALLGWILYDAGDLTAAAKRFEQAAGDSVPRVRDSAKRGLEAIRRKQTPQPGE